jgi:DNA-binding NtrC family response regulator
MVQRYEELKEIAKSKNILIVDDDSIMRTVLTKNLSEVFEHVYSAIDGKTALELYKDIGKVDLVITDIKMKDMGGIELVTSIKSIHKEQKCIVMSMNKNPDELIELIDIHVDAYVPKPFARKVFFDKIVEVLKY